MISHHLRELTNSNSVYHLKQEKKGKPTMPREIYPSSYECDCGHISDFSEGTVEHMKKMSGRKKVRLCDYDNHTIVFYRGKMVEIICPNREEK